eukprot:4857015-Amphidinium_carterae.1
MKEWSYALDQGAGASLLFIIRKPTFLTRLTCGVPVVEHLQISTLLSWTVRVCKSQRCFIELPLFIVDSCGSTTCTLL